MPRLRRLTVVPEGDRQGPAPTELLTAAIYCRISKDTEERRAGVERQEADCRAIAAAHGYHVPDDFVFIDNNLSAWKRNRNRPGWDELIGGMQVSRFDAVICWNPDRLMRQPVDLEALLNMADDSLARGRPVRLVGTANSRDLNDPNERFMLRIEIAQAAKSSDDTSRRAKRALLDNAQKGKPHGGTRPFGYEKGGMLIRESEAAVVRDIVDRVIEGESLNAIAVDLNNKGITTAMGKKWWPNSLRSLLNNCRIAGLRAHNGTIIGQAMWPGIVDEDTWTRMQDILEQRNVAWNQEAPPRNYYLLRGVLRCTCGTKMTGEKRADKRVYRCKVSSATQACGKRLIHAEPAEAYLTGTLIHLMVNRDFSAVEGVEMSSEIARAMELDQRQLDDLREDAMAFRINMDDYDRHKKAIVERMARLQQKIAGTPLKQVRDLTGPDFPARWATFTNQKKNQVFRMVYSEVRVLEPAEDAPRGFDPRRLQPVPKV